MSASYTQWCKLHGEWDMDIDNISECPDCIRLGLTEIQQLRIALESADSMKSAWNAACEELTNLKEAFTRLKEDRDMHSQMRQDNRKEALRLFAENIELKRMLKGEHV